MDFRRHFATAVAFATLGVIGGCSSSGSADATKAPDTVTATPPPPRGPGGPGKFGPIAATDGKGMFAAGCQGCHGMDGKNGRAPILAGKNISTAEITKVVTDGKGRMPSFKSRLTSAQIDTLAKYVSTM